VSISFYNQDRNWQIEQQRWSDTFSSAGAVGSVLGNALTNQSAGFAAIANHQALARVVKQLKAAATTALGASALSSLNTTSSSLKNTQKSASTGSSLNLLA
jgi:hypothetical protein